MSKHFIIDAEEETDPGKLVAAFEELYAAVVRALVTTEIEIPARIRVVALPSRQDAKKLLGTEGAYFRSIHAREPLIVISAEPVNYLPGVVAHELAHMVSFYVLPRQQLWFAEGLAQFVESLGSVDDEGRRFAGGRRTLPPRSFTLMPTQALFSPNPEPDTAFYWTSWLLYRYLWNERGAQFSDYWQRLAKGESADDAWHAAFPEWDPSTGTTARLDSALEVYRRQSALGLLWEVKVHGADRSFTTAAASRAEVHMILLWLELRQMDQRQQDSLRRRVSEEVLREDPDYPGALLELAKLEKKPVLPAMRIATASHPDDGLAWYLLGHNAEEWAEREGALRRAMALWPDFATARVELASLLASTGRAREALAIAKRGVELAPWNPFAVACLAEVAIALGHCEKGIELQARAVDLSALAGKAMVKSDTGLRHTLADYRARCEGSKDDASISY